MPLIDGVETSPDDAIAKDCCPECGKDLTKIHARSHRNEHWTGPVGNAREQQEAHRRIKLFDDYLKAHPEAPAKESA